MPQQDLFHVHDGDCSWSITLTGNESSSQVKVEISNKVRLLPLIDAAASLVGAGGEDGTIEVKVSVAQDTQPAWVAQSELGQDPSSWMEAWVKR